MYRFIFCLAIIASNCLSLFEHPFAVAQDSMLSAAQRAQLAEAQEYKAIAIKFNDMGLANDARMTAERGLARCKQVLGDSSPETADFLSDLGLICREQADYKFARTCLDQALAINKKERGLEDPATATVLERLSVLLELQANVPTARDYSEQALKIRRKVLGENHPSIVNSLTYLGELMRLQGEFDEAQPISEQALALSKKIHGENHRDTGKAYAALGDYFLVRGDLEKAKPNYERALAIRKKVLTEQHPETASSMMRWGLMLVADGKNVEGLPLIDKAMEINRKMRGEDHPETGSVFNAQGQYFLYQSDAKSGIEKFEKVLAIQKKHFGENHHDTAVSFLNLGQAHFQNGDLDTAYSLTNRALEILRSYWGVEHPDTANAGYVFGNILFSQGHYDDARLQFVLAMNTFKGMFGDESDHAATGYYYLGMTGRAQKYYKTARKYYEKSLSLYEKNHGDEFASSIGTRSELGTLLFEMQEYDEARKQFERLLSLRRKALGNEHADTAEAASMLGVTLDMQSNYVDARKYYDEALSIRLKLFGEEDLRTALTQFNIGLLLRAEKNNTEAQKFFRKALVTRKKLLGEEHHYTKEVLKVMEPVAPLLAKNADLPKSDGAPGGLESYGNLFENRSRKKDSAPSDDLMPVTPVPPPAPPSAPAPPPTPLLALVTPALPLAGNDLSNVKSSGSDLITPQDFAKLSPAQRERLQNVIPQYQKAVEFFQKGQVLEFLPIAEKLSIEFTEIFGPVHKLTVLTVSMRGAALSALGEYDAALPILEQSLALQIQLSGEKNLETASTLFAVADLYANRGELKKSRELADRCLAIRKQLLGENAPLTAQALTQLGTIAMKAGDYDLAKVHLEKSASIQMSAFRPTDPNAVQTINNLAGTITSIAYIQQLSGDFLKAREKHEAVLALRRNVLGDQHPDTGLSYVQMAILYSNLGDYGQSKKYLEQARDVFLAALGEHHPNVARMYTGLGEIYIVQKDFPAARTHLERALSILEKAFGKNHPDCAATLISFGKLEQANGNYKAARDYFDNVATLTKNAFGNDNSANIAPVYNILDSLLLQGKFTEARPFAEELVRLVQLSIGKDSFDKTVALNGLCQVLAGLNDWPEATKQMDTARRLVRKLAAEVLPGLSERELLLCLRTGDEEFWHSALSMGVARKEDQAVVDLSAGWLVNGKGIAQESLAQQQATRLAKKEGVASKAAADTEKWVELETVRKALPEDTTLFDIARIRVRNFSSTTREDRWGEAHYLAWVIPPSGSGIVRIVDLGDAESIDNLVADFNLAMKASMTIGKNKGRIEELGDVEAIKLIDKPLQALASRLIEPLRSDIEKSKKIVLSPDASLWLIPWATLPVSGEKYLIEDHSLQLIISSRDLVASIQEEMKLSPPVIMADPGFDLNSQQVQTATKAVLRSDYQPLQSSSLRSAILTGDLAKVSRLPNTAIEAKVIIPNIEQITKDKPQVYMGEFALEGVFKKVKQPKMMVISTHGIFLPAKNKTSSAEASFVPFSKDAENSLGAPTENPLLRCGLLLAGCNQRPVSQTDDDGILTGDEIVACNLRGTEMVVLSACETGIGEVRNGDGVAGLRQAFQLAGAKSVVATLWMIDDRESALFMRDFFEHLGAGESRSDAMRSAQLERIEARRNRFGAAHPFYWAAWTVTDRF